MASKIEHINPRTRIKAVTVEMADGSTYVWDVEQDPVQRRLDLASESIEVAHHHEQATSFESRAVRMEPTGFQDVAVTLTNCKTGRRLG